jgi:hypothetical protein
LQAGTVQFAATYPSLVQSRGRVVQPSIGSHITYLQLSFVAAHVTVVNTQPFRGSQESIVQLFLSLHFRVDATHPVLGKQV